MMNRTEQWARTQEQETQPLPIIPPGLRLSRHETAQQRYQRLKAISDATGTRLLFVYLAEQKRTRQRPAAPFSPYPNTDTRSNRDEAHARST